MKKLMLFVGARPNFMKAAPLCKALSRAGIPYEIYHSGQHYDTNLSSIFHKQLCMEKINHMGCSTNGNAIKNIQDIIRRTKIILYQNASNTGHVVVFGDVATTYAVALAAKAMDFSLIHVESGLRSFDISMPEELIRISVDHMSDILFAPSQDAVQNLENEIGQYEGTHMVGNIMIDCLVNFLPDINKRDPVINTNKPYIIVTLHRPENVDNKEQLLKIIDNLVSISNKIDVIFPMHPRTKNRLKEFGIGHYINNINLRTIDPVGYLDFMRLIVKSQAVITDSGGIQEETSFLGIPCFTLRKNTERPITITLGTNHLCSVDNLLNEIVHTKVMQNVSIPLWDGKTSERIVNIMKERYL